MKVAILLLTLASTVCGQTYAADVLVDGSANVLMIGASQSDVTTGTTLAQGAKVPASLAQLSDDQGRAFWRLSAGRVEYQDPPRVTFNRAFRRATARRLMLKMDDLTRRSADVSRWQSLYIDIFDRSGELSALQQQQDALAATIRTLVGSQ